MVKYLYKQLPIWGTEPFNKCERTHFSIRIARHWSGGARLRLRHACLKMFNGLTCRTKGIPAQQFPSEETAVFGSNPGIPGKKTDDLQSHIQWANCRKTARYSSL